MAHLDGKVSVKVKLLDITVILGIEDISTNDTVEMRLTPAQMQKLQESGVWFKNADNGSVFDPVLARRIQENLGKK